MKKRRYLTCILLAWLLPTLLMAVPAKRGVWQSILLADGTRGDVQLLGDETLHYYQSADGTCYLADGDTFVKADPLQLAQQAKLRVGTQNTRRQARAARRVGGAGQVYSGKKKGLIILAQFRDLSFAEGHDPALFRRIANEPGYHSDDGFKGSVSDYFKAQSNGLFDIDFDVVGPVTLNNNYAYYGRDMAGYPAGEDVRPGKMVAEACMAVDSEVDFSLYDWEGNGEVDQVYVLYAGLGQANGGDSNTVWPHEWTLEESDYGDVLTLDGVTVNTYACSAELQPVYNASGTKTGAYILDGIGTLCHEFSHCLGFPDMYDTNGVADGMYYWDLMDMGCYLSDGFIPCGYTSYEKMVAGWLTPTELTSDTQVNGMKALSEGGEAYIVYNDNHPEEFFLLENRQPTGWDSALYGSGLLIVHVDYDAEAWEENTVNDLPNHQRCTVVPADGATQYIRYEEGKAVFDRSAIAGDPYPYLQNDSLTNNSEPAARLFNANSDGKKYLNKALQNITRNSDGTVTFRFEATSVRLADDDLLRPGTVLLHESFDQCRGTGGNDRLWSGQIATSDFLPDLDGWVSARAYGGDQCARFGTGQSSGVVYSPNFTLDGEVTLTFTAAPWTGDTPSLDVYMVDANDANADGTLLDSYTLTSGQWNTISETISGDGREYCLLFIASRRFFLDDVKVYVPEDNAVGALSAVPSLRQNNRIYSIDGRPMGTDWHSLPTGIYLRNGKKLVR